MNYPTGPYTANFTYSIFKCRSTFPVPPFEGNYYFLQISLGNRSNVNSIDTIVYRIAAASFNCNGNNTFTLAPGNWGALGDCVWPATLTVTAAASCSETCLPCASSGAVGGAGFTVLAPTPGGPFNFPFDQDYCIFCRSCIYGGCDDAWFLEYDAARAMWYLSSRVNYYFSGIYQCTSGPYLYECPANNLKNPSGSFTCTGQSAFSWVSGAEQCGPGPPVHYHDTVLVKYDPSCVVTVCGGDASCCGWTPNNPGPTLLVAVQGPGGCCANGFTFSVPWSSSLAFGNGFASWQLRGATIPGCTNATLIVTVTCNGNAWSVSIHSTDGPSGDQCDLVTSVSGTCSPLNLTGTGNFAGVNCFMAGMGVGCFGIWTITVTD